MRQPKSPLFIIFLVVFIDLVGFGIVIPILPYYASSYGARATELGWLMTIYSALQFFFAPVWGRVSDRVGRRPVLLLSMCGTALSMALLGWAPSLAWLFAGRALAGICGANISTATAYISDVTAPKDRAKGMGMIGAAFGLGFIFGPAIGGALSVYGYGAPMFAAAGLAACNVAFAFFKLAEPPTSQELREKNRARRFDWKAWAETLGDRQTRLATASFFLVTLAITQMEVSFALFMKARHGYDARGAGLLLAYMGAIMVVIQGGLIGRLSGRFGETKLVATGTVLMMAALMTLSASTTMSPVFVAMALLAIGNGITNPSLSSLASKGAKPESRGMTMGIYQSAGSLARVVGPILAGLLYDRLGIEIPFVAASFIMLCAGVGVILVTQRDWIRKATAEFRTRGFRGLLRAYGWKLAAFFVAYYLIRDVSLYILLPWLAAKRLIHW